MPATPAKRVTRSRAAATKPADDMNAPAKRAAAPKPTTSRRAKPDTEETKKVQDTTATTVAQKPPQTMLQSAPTIPAARRRIRVTQLDIASSEEKSVAAAATAKPVAKKSKNVVKPKKEMKTGDAVPGDQPQSEQDDKIARPKSRQKAAAGKDEASETQKTVKTRGRPKKAAPPEPSEESQQSQPVRQTRARTVSGAAANQAANGLAANPSAATRKKVTFQDLPESDKENQPLVTRKLASKREGTSTASGLRAKPVRKPATISGRKMTRTTKDASSVSKPVPLSPKKVTQVAKSSSPGSSDDELSGAKTPVRDLSQSPKRSAAFGGSLSPVKKLDFGTALLPKSPDREAPGMTLMSPPRKLPSSPFKDTLRESPKRGEATLIFPPSALRATAATVIPGSTSQSQSVLLQSPKRGAMNSSIFTQSAIKAFKSPAKSVLMQSPPKRLWLSSKPPGPDAPPTRVDNVSLNMREASLDNQPSDVAVSCGFRASQSPDRFMRVHKLSSDNPVAGECAGIDFDESVLDIRSPVKASKPSVSSLQIMTEHVESLPIFSAELSPVQPTSQELSTSSCQDTTGSCSVIQGESMEGISISLSDGNVESSYTPAMKVSSAEIPNFSIRPVHLRDEEESSEDELQADTTPFHIAQTETPDVAGKDGRSRMSTVNPVEMSKGIGFTPLATQFSNWLAASPEKDSGQTSQHRGLFSPLAAQHVPGKVQISRQSTPQRRSAGSRVTMATTSPADCQSVNSVRKSRPSFMTDTPQKSSFFADEMAIRDFADELEEVDESLGQCVTSPKVVEDTDFSTFMKDSAGEGSDETEPLALEHLAQLKDISIDTHAQDCVSMVNSPNSPRFFLTEADVEAAGGVTQSSVEVGEHNRGVAHRALSSINDHATPIQKTILPPRVLNTVVSKVPLRPEGLISPIKIPRKRSRSLSGGPSSAKKPIFAPSLVPLSNNIRPSSPERHVTSPAVHTPGQQSFIVDDFGDSTLDSLEIDDDDENMPPPTPATNIKTTSLTPRKAPLKTLASGILQGAVVFVDVYTTEGADASGIFVELLNQMGAKTVRQWSWNPRASVAATETESENVIPGGIAGKVGITHVVYKDGGKRTLEKVREAGGVVRCVGVGWVLDCERENVWLDEVQYAVDTSLMPRGGSRRRKSMEPRALLNMNGALSAQKSRRSVSAEVMVARKAELIATPIRANVKPLETRLDLTIADDGDDCMSNSPDSSFSTPTGIQAAFGASTTSSLNNAAAFATPTGHVSYDPSNEMSPTTPYYLSQGAKLVQQTCPPKQTQQGLFHSSGASHERMAGGLGFPVTGRVEDQPDENVRTKLEAARRKTMNWRPRVASPLGRWD